MIFSYKDFLFIYQNWWHLCISASYGHYTATFSHTEAPAPNSLARITIICFYLSAGLLVDDMQAKLSISYCLYSTLPHKTCLLRTLHVFSDKTNMCKMRHLSLRIDPVQNSLLHMHWLHALPTNWHVKQTGMSVAYPYSIIINDFRNINI